jgi:hypothetical protein
MLAVKFNCVDAQIVGTLLYCVLMLMPGTTGGNTEMVSGAETAVAGNGHAAADAICTPITSPFCGFVIVNVEPVTPVCTLPLRVHVYDGDAPAPVLTAVKVAGTPGHTAPFGKLLITETAVAVVGLTVTGRATGVEVPQPFTAATWTVPLPADAPVTEMLPVVELPPKPGDSVHT